MPAERALWTEDARLEKPIRAVRPFLLHCLVALRAGCHNWQLVGNRSLVVIVILREEFFAYANPSFGAVACATTLRGSLLASRAEDTKSTLLPSG